MADEIDRGQASGEVARKHDNQHTMDVRGADNHAATYDDLGITRQRVAEWRDVRDDSSLVAMPTRTWMARSVCWRAKEAICVGVLAT